MFRLIATRGLPASGKTTFARRLQPDVVRVNRDDLRRMMHGARLFTQWAEGQVTRAQRAQVEALLAARVSVCVDDTNLRSRTLRDWAELAERFGMSAPAISRHLSILENAGLVTSQRRGQFVYYALQADSVANTLTSYALELCPTGRPLKREAKAAAGKRKPDHS